MGCGFSSAARVQPNFNYLKGRPSDRLQLIWARKDEYMRLFDTGNAGDSVSAGYIYASRKAAEAMLSNQVPGWFGRLLCTHQHPSSRYAVCVAALGALPAASLEIQFKMHEAQARISVYAMIQCLGPCPAQYDSVIRSDVGRCFPSLSRLLGRSESATSLQRSLFRLLSAYAWLDDGVGYCQGMSFLAALLLLSGVGEELAFYCFVRLAMQEHMVTTSSSESSQGCASTSIPAPASASLGSARVPSDKMRDRDSLAPPSTRIALPGSRGLSLPRGTASDGGNRHANDERTTSMKPAQPQHAPVRYGLRFMWCDGLPALHSGLDSIRTSLEATDPRLIRHVEQDIGLRLEVAATPWLLSCGCATSLPVSSCMQVLDGLVEWAWRAGMSNTESGSRGNATQKMENDGAEEGAAWCVARDGDGDSASMLRAWLPSSGPRLYVANRLRALAGRCAQEVSLRLHGRANAPQAVALELPGTGSEAKQLVADEVSQQQQGDSHVKGEGKAGGTQTEARRTDPTGSESAASLLRGAATPSHSPGMKYPPQPLMALAAYQLAARSARLLATRSLSVCFNTCQEQYVEAIRRSHEGELDSAKYCHVSLSSSNTISRTSCSSNKDEQKDGQKGLELPIATAPNITTGLTSAKSPGDGLPSYFEEDNAPLEQPIDADSDHEELEEDGELGPGAAPLPAQASAPPQGERTRSRGPRARPYSARGRALRVGEHILRQVVTGLRVRGAHTARAGEASAQDTSSASNSIGDTASSSDGQVTVSLVCQLPPGLPTPLEQLCTELTVLDVGSIDQAGVASRVNSGGSSDRARRPFAVDGASPGGIRVGVGDSGQHRALGGTAPETSGSLAVARLLREHMRSSSAGSVLPLFIPFDPAGAARVSVFEASLPAAGSDSQGTQDGSEAGQFGPVSKRWMHGSANVTGAVGSSHSSHLDAAWPVRPRQNGLIGMEAGWPILGRHAGVTSAVIPSNNPGREPGADVDISRSVELAQRLGGSSLMARECDVVPRWAWPKRVRDAMSKPLSLV